MPRLRYGCLNARRCDEQPGFVLVAESVTVTKSAGSNCHDKRLKPDAAQNVRRGEWAPLWLAVLNLAFGVQRRHIQCDRREHGMDIAACKAMQQDAAVV
jgi:hypothetical protein